MPSLRFRNRFKKQKCVYWKRESINKFGEPEYALPVVLKCRWDNTESEQVSSEITQDITASVHLSQRVYEGDYLLNSSSWTNTTSDSVILASITSTTNPIENSEAVKINSTSVNPDYRNRTSEYVANA